ncbi:hypothetical protein [Paenibacillus wynnii]|uniref:hypothetical protein n=1 Tax=Paenibacillus wynnii TaxID=268407 RepID=UPI0012FBD97D|nr:hypothetical protein [Paenibacillus wynnii]
MLLVKRKRQEALSVLYDRYAGLVGLVPYQPEELESIPDLDFDKIGITLEPDDKGDQPRGQKMFGSV